MMILMVCFVITVLSGQGQTQALLLTFLYHVLHVTLIVATIATEKQNKTKFSRKLEINHTRNQC
jgi:hypothetical protein